MLSLPVSTIASRSMPRPRLGVNVLAIAAYAPGWANYAPGGTFWRLHPPLASCPGDGDRAMERAVADRILALWAGPGEVRSARASRRDGCERNGIQSSRCWFGETFRRKARASGAP
jgi:hypothetical protein